MALENILEVLSLEMEGVKLDRETLFENKDLILGYRTVSSNFPEVVKVLKSPTIMYKYLQLSPEDKEKVSTFTKENSDYIVGKGDLSGRNLNSILTKNKFSENAKEIIRLNNRINVVQQAFTDYLENRKIGDTTPFDKGYFQSKELNKDSNNKFRNLYQNSNNNFKSEGGFNYLLDLAQEKGPNIRDYRSLKSLILLESPILIEQAFNHYLENREIGDSNLFCSEYFRSEELNKNSNNKFYKLCTNCKSHFKSEGGLDYLLDLAQEKGSDISNYRSLKSLILLESPILIEQAVNHYLENREIGDSNLFCSRYFKSEELNKNSNNKFHKLYKNSNKHFKSEGGLDYLLNLTQEKGLNILDYKDKQSLILLESPILIEQAFNHYLENRKIGNTTPFGPGYFQSKELNKDSNNKFINLYQNSIYHFKSEGGLYYLLSQAIKINPQIYNYLHYKTKKSIDKLK